MLPKGSRHQTTTHPPQHPPWSPSPESLAPPYTPGPPTPELAITGRPVCCSYVSRQTQRETSTRQQIYLVVFPNLAHKVAESFIDVDTLLGRGLDKFATEMFGEVATLYQVILVNGRVSRRRERVGVPFMPT